MNHLSSTRPFRTPGRGLGALLVLITSFSGLPALAQAPAPATVASAASVPLEMADGEVRRIDKAAAKLTLKHGEIKHLDMPGMTMVFQVKEAAMLDPLKVGDRVKFRAEKGSSGFVVTAIEALR